MYVGPFLCPVFAVLLIGTLAWLIFGCGRKGVDSGLGTETACPRCQHFNPTHARYCARCGRCLG